MLETLLRKHQTANENYFTEKPLADGNEKENCLLGKISTLRVVRGGGVRVRYSQETFCCLKSTSLEIHFRSVSNVTHHAHRPRHPITIHRVNISFLISV